MTEHTYVLHPGKDTTTLAQRVQLFLSQAENMETQTLYTEDGATIIQGRVRNGGVKQLMGLDRTITVLITPLGDSAAKVSFSKGKWLDKVVTGTVSMFVLWPLLLTASYGAFKQSQLPKKITGAIEAYLAE